MARIQINNFWSFLQNNRKARIICIVVAVCIVMAIAGVVIAKTCNLKDLISNKKAEQKLIEEANKNIETSQLSYTQDQYNTYATRLYKAMKGIGTNEKAIYTVFEAMNTYSDVQQLVKTFGIKDGETLKEWLYGDLSNSELAHLNEILSSKSINYQF